LFWTDLALPDLLYRGTMDHLHAEISRLQKDVSCFRRFVALACGSETDSILRLWSDCLSLESDVLNKVITQDLFLQRLASLRATILALQPRLQSSGAATFYVNSCSHLLDLCSQSMADPSQPKPQDGSVALPTPHLGSLKADAPSSPSRDGPRMSVSFSESSDKSPARPNRRSNLDRMRSQSPTRAQMTLLRDRSRYSESSEWLDSSEPNPRASGRASRLEHDSKDTSASRSPVSPSKVQPPSTTLPQSSPSESTFQNPFLSPRSDHKSPSQAPVSLRLDDADYSKPKTIKLLFHVYQPDLTAGASVHAIIVPALEAFGAILEKVASTTGVHSSVLQSSVWHKTNTNGVVLQRYQTPASAALREGDIVVVRLS